MAVKRKKILELYDYGDGLSIRKISELLGSSRNTVRRVIDKAGELGITKEVLATESAAGIDALFRDAGGSDDGRFAPIDYAYVAKELDRRGVNRKLLWKEYCQESAQLGQTPYQYSQFCELFRQWSGKSNVTVRLVHKPGYACQVDWVGLTGEVFSKITGEPSKAYYFVMTMPYSGYMYVEAFPDMRMGSWIAGHNHAYEFFGGVPAITIPDNLRTGVDRSDPYEPLLNETYEQLGDHYGTAIVPAKVYYPKGKAQVERTVAIVETWVIAALRNKTFFSFGELNEQVSLLAADLNDQVAKEKGASRRALFESDEAAKLQPLPATGFEHAEWRKAKLQQDCHFQVERMRYSAPAALVGSELDVRLTQSGVAVYKDGNLVCIHKRLYGRAGQYSTVEEHMPAHLRQSTNKLWSAQGFTAWAHKVGPSTEACVKAILDSKKIVEQAYRSCRGLKSLADKHGHQALEAACAQALSITPVPSYTQVKNLIAKAESAPVGRTDTSRLVNGRIGSLGYLRDPSQYSTPDSRRDDDGNGARDEGEEACR